MPGPTKAIEFRVTEEQVRRIIGGAQGCERCHDLPTWVLAAVRQHRRQGVAYATQDWVEFIERAPPRR